MRDVNKIRNDVLDLLKWVASFFIVCIHFKFPGKVGELVTILARFAVPVFFMISGYYAYRDDRAELKRKLTRVAKLYLSAIVIYVCYNLAVKLLAGQTAEAVWYVSTYVRPRYMLPLLLFNESNTAMHLWFLGVLLYLYIIEWWLAGKPCKDRARYTVAGVCLCLHLILGIGLSVLHITPPAFLLKNYVLRNFLFLGFPLFTLGQMLRKYEDKVKRVSGGVFVGAILLGVAEAFVMHGIDWTKELYLGSLLIGVSLFVLALKGQREDFPPLLTKVLRTSTWVYVLHVLIGEVLLRVFPVGPVVIFAVSVLVAFVRDRVMQIKLK